MKKEKCMTKFWTILMTIIIVLSMVPQMAIAATYGDVTISIPSGENLSLSGPAQSGNTYTYNVVSSITGYNPYNFSLNVLPDAGVTVTVTGENGATVTQDGTLPDNTTYWLVTPSDASASNVRITSGTYTYIINCSIPSGGASAGTGVYAFLPAPGQFPNEGVNTGGWGDVFVSGSNGLKGMVNSISSTGVSLGYFGGYIAFDMGENISNSATNPFGVDFITYGNAFSNNSEPGCIQVAPDANSDGVPDAWYDIAGSLHYNNSTVWNSSYTYTNPVPGDDLTNQWPTSGTITTSGIPFVFTPAASDGTSSGTITYNTYHRHSWFPLYANYFVSRNNIGPMDKTYMLPFGVYSRQLNTNTTLTLKGVKLGSATNTQTANYKFGYADVHPNGSNYGIAANPYAATASTTGGDGIDISWAVDSDGTPAELTSIRFVRIYTGAAAMNGVFGEISTEVCGVYKASGSTNATAVEPTITGTQAGGSATTISTTNGEMTTLTDLTTGDYTLNVVGTGYIFVNGQSVTSGTALTFTPSSAGTKVQIIVQNGDAAPYITWLNLKSSS